MQANTIVEKNFSDEALLDPLFNQEVPIASKSNSHSVKQSMILPKQEVQAIKKQTHSLANNQKPEDMPDTFWNTAVLGASTSIIHSSVKEESLNSHIDGYIVDDGKKQ